MKYLITILLIVNSAFVSAQQNKILFNLSAGVGTGWWIQESDYKIADETVTDWANSRLSMDAPLSVMVEYNFNDKIHAGIGFTYHKLLAKNLYASSPFTPSSTKTKIGESSVNFNQYYIIIGAPILKNSSVHIIPNIHAGTFTFESLHPDDAFFTRNILLEANLKILFPSKQGVHPFIEMYYSNLSFKSDVSFVYNRIHNVQSIGTKFGLTF